MIIKYSRARQFFYICLLFILGSCAVNTSYVGKSYAPTKRVDLYVGWHDVPPRYETMGYIDATPIGLSSIEDAQKKIEKMAAEKGADAVVLEGVESRMYDPTTTTTKNSTPNTNGGHTTTSTTTQTSQQMSTLKATFIKYK